MTILRCLFQDDNNLKLKLTDVGFFVVGRGVVGGVEEVGFGGPPTQMSER